MTDAMVGGGEELRGAGFQLHDWTVEPGLNRLTRGGEVVHLRPKVMDVLVFLAGRAGEVVSKGEITEAVWAKKFLADTALGRAVFELRAALGDDPAEADVRRDDPQEGIPSVGDGLSGALPFQERPIRTRCRDGGRSWVGEGSVGPGRWRSRSSSWARWGARVTTRRWRPRSRRSASRCCRSRTSETRRTPSLPPVSPRRSRRGSRR